jgi:hypothetical protein
MDILEVLKDDEQYYNGVGKEFLSNSDIGTLLTNPKDYGKTRSDNKNFAGGRYFHQLLIEPDKAEGFPFVDVSTRTTKAYKEFCEDNNLDFAMLKKEQDEIKELVSIMKRNIQFYDAIYADGNQYEVPAVGEIQGMMWKGKADIVGNVIIDLKTTSDIQKFRWSASAYNYDSQCYIYQELFGKPLVFYVIDKETGMLGIFTPSEEFVMRGRDKVTRAIEVYKKYFGSNPTDDIDNHCIVDVI